MSDLSHAIVLLSTALQKLKEIEAQIEQQRVASAPDVEAARQQEYISFGNTGE
jgi:hypothetical protein